MKFFSYLFFSHLNESCFLRAHLVSWCILIFLVSGWRRKRDWGGFYVCLKRVRRGRGKGRGKKWRSTENSIDFVKWTNELEDHCAVKTVFRILFLLLFLFFSIFIFIFSLFFLSMHFLFYYLFFFIFCTIIFILCFSIFFHHFLSILQSAYFSSWSSLFLMNSFFLTILSLSLSLSSAIQSVPLKNWIYSHLPSWYWIYSQSISSLYSLIQNSD